MLTRFLFVLSFVFIFVFIAKSAPGDLDPTFGNGGKITYRFSDREDSFQGVVIQPDNKIVIAGKKGDGKLILMRLNPDGSLDTSFASAGTFTFGSVSSPFCEAIALQEDRKIVVAGHTNLGGNNSAYLVIRLNPDGTIDNAFGNNGAAITNLSEGRDLGRDLAIQTDGKLVVTGSVNDRGTSGGDIGVVRYNTDGSLDNSFDSDGMLITPMDDTSEEGFALKLQTDGKIVVSANSDNFNLQKFYHLVIRYLPNGSLDPDFGVNGISRTDLGTSYFLFGDIDIQNDGKIITLGSIGNNSEFVYAFTAFRFLPNGSPDVDFGADGKTVITSNTTNSAQKLLIQPDGKILAVGHDWVTGSGLDILVARLNPDGSFDTSFGSNGRVYTRVGAAASSEYAWDAALQKDGKLVVVGDFSLSLFDYDALVLRFLGDPPARQNKSFDFDGDGKADISVFRPENRVWYLNQSSAGFSAIQFGLTADKIVPADYDGDGKTDFAVFRPDFGYWFLQQSGDGFSAVQFGQNGDIPVPADYDGDGKTDIAVYRPSEGTWYRLNSSNGEFVAVRFGAEEDKPTVGDFDGDGEADIAVFRPSTGSWYRLNSGNGQFVAVQFGVIEDKTVPADFDGDGKTDIAVFRPSTGNWYRLNSSNGEFVAISFGLPEDLPTAADYDGDGKVDIAVFRPSEGNWYLLRSTSGFMAIQFGLPNDNPVPNAFVR